MSTFIPSLGRVCAVIGAQWGDEGKGKAIDMLAESFDVIARASGGANAGHTIFFGGKKHVFHLLPSGCFHAKKKVILGSGMVIHLPTLLQEIKELEDAGIEIRGRLGISYGAHIVLECYKNIDAALEERRSKGGTAIGTTKRGIGPAYMFKAMRSGLRMESLHMPETELKAEVLKIADLSQSLFGVKVDVDRELASLLAAAKELAPSLTTMSILLESLAKKEKILVEGAQATLLDIDHGTYPYVTSSATTAAGALQGLGLPPSCLTSVIGVAKAYCTRVGGGEFPTEATGDAEARLRERGGEYGATTGRPRRCGWLHIPALNVASLINGFSAWNITKLDVLDDEDEIPVGIARTDQDAQAPVPYEYLPGWKASTKGIRLFEDLPKNAQRFITFIEEKTMLPVRLIGTGPNREDMIVR